MGKGDGHAGVQGLAGQCQGVLVGKVMYLVQSMICQEGGEIVLCTQKEPQERIRVWVFEFRVYVLWFMV